MKIGAIIQARTSSTRLPQKVLKPLPFNSKTNVLQQVIRRVSKSELIDEIIIATTIHDEDEKIVEVAEEENVTVLKGSRSRNDRSRKKRVEIGKNWMKYLCKCDIRLLQIPWLDW